jgi:hypothetical protein
MFFAISCCCTRTGALRTYAQFLEAFNFGISINVRCCRNLPDPCQRCSVSIYANPAFSFRGQKLTSIMTCSENSSTWYELISTIVDSYHNIHNHAMMRIAGQKVVVAWSPGAFTLSTSRISKMREKMFKWFLCTVVFYLNGQHARFCSMISVWLWMKLWLKVSASGVSGWPRAVSPPVRHAAPEKDPHNTRNSRNTEQQIQSDQSDPSESKR